MRAVALLGPSANDSHVRQFDIAGVNIFSGNDLEPTDQPDAALIFGGDGTIHRHLAGLASKKIPTLVVPLGSANDFAASIGLNAVSDSLHAWRRFCERGDNTRLIDLGTVQPLDRSVALSSSTGRQMPDAERDQPWKGESLETLHFVPSGPRRDLPQMGPRIMQSQLRRATEAELDMSNLTYFGCIAGTGLDAAVNRLTLNQPRWLRGHGGYVIAMLQVLGKFEPPHVRVSVEADGVWQTRIDEPGFLIAVGNGPRYGHGMRLTHRAKLDDGLLDVCFVRVLSKMRLLRLFRVVYQGEHLGLKEVEYFQARRVRIETEPTTEVFADGEYIINAPVEIGLEPKALRLITPAT